MDNKLQYSLFHGREKEDFIVQVNDELAVTLVLHEVKALEPPPEDALPLVEGIELCPEPFSLIFHGPADLSLPQHQYLLQHAELGPVGPLFLVPVGQDNQGRHYQVVIN